VVPSRSRALGSPNPPPPAPSAIPPLAALRPAEGAAPRRQRRSHPSRTYSGSGTRKTSTPTTTSPNAVNRSARNIPDRYPARLPHHHLMDVGEHGRKHHYRRRAVDIQQKRHADGGELEPRQPQNTPARNAATSATNLEVLSTGPEKGKPPLVTPKRGRSRQLVIELL
jgi:hypothetical protein